MQEQDANIVRGAAVPTLAVGVLLAVIFGVRSGLDGVIGAGLGTVLVIIFFGLSWLVIGRASQSGPTAMMGAAFGTYIVKIVLLGILLATLRDTTAFDFQAFAWGVLVGTIVFMAFEVRAFLRQRILYVDPNVSPPV